MEQQRREQIGDRRLQRVEHERRGGEILASGAQHVGRADVAGADRAQIAGAEQAASAAGRTGSSRADSRATSASAA